MQRAKSVWSQQDRRDRDRCNFLLHGHRFKSIRDLHLQKKKCINLIKNFTAMTEVEQIDNIGL